MLIDLAPCDKLITDDVKEISKISNFLPGLLEIAQVKLLELAASNNTKQLRSTTEELLTEYDKLQDQHIQLTKLLETNMDLINRRRKIINGLESSVDKKENDYNIKREIIMDDVSNAKAWDGRLDRYYFYMKLMGTLFIIVTVMLVLLIDIGKIL
jgi:transposase-like protein